jgi:hypothetical protein
MGVETTIKGRKIVRSSYRFREGRKRERDVRVVF